MSYGGANRKFHNKQIKNSKKENGINGVWQNKIGSRTGLFEKMVLKFVLVILFVMIMVEVRLGEQDTLHILEKYFGITKLNHMS